MTHWIQYGYNDVYITIQCNAMNDEIVNYF